MSVAPFRDEHTQALCARPPHREPGCGHAGNPSMRTVEAAKSETQGPPQQQRESEASPVLKTNTNKQHFIVIPSCTHSRL